MKASARTLPAPLTPLLAPLRALLVPALLVSLAGCDDGGSQGGGPELEPGPATEGVPGAAGSVTPHQWDTDPGQIVNREQFDERWSAGGRPAFWPGAEEGLDLEAFAAGLHQAWDEDGSGAVDRAEWEQGVGWLGGSGRGEWSEWDASDDGRLDRGELAEALRRHELFARVDRDGSGVVEDRELADWWFDVWDEDDDQRLQPAEREALEGAEQGNG